MNLNEHILDVTGSVHEGGVEFIGQSCGVTSDKKVGLLHDNSCLKDTALLICIMIYY